MGSTISAYDALLKRRYSDKARVEKLMYGDRPLLGLLTKAGDTGMVGSSMPVPFIYSNPQGASASFANAQANATNVKPDQWLITAGDYYGVVEIGDKVLAASRTNVGAFLDNKIAETDGLYETCSEDLDIYLWGNGGQALGQRASISTNTVTLTNPETAANFEVGMTVVASAADGSTSTDTLRAGSTTVTAVDRGNGTITLASAAAITGFANSDYLFRQGDFFGTTGTIVIKGVQCFVTATDTPMALWGVSAAQRLVDLQRYSGCRVPTSVISNKSFEERLRILGAYMAGRYKSNMQEMAGFMHPEDWQVLETLMMARGTRAAEDTSTQFGYMSISCVLGGKNVKIYPARNCPKGSFFLFNMKDWWISSMLELLHPQNGDGFEMLRRDASTDYEYRLISYPLLANRAPKNSGRVSLT